MNLAGAGPKQQVERLLHSKTLGGSEVHRRLLEYLAEKTLSGDAENLKEYTIALDALGKPSTYDPRRESVVRIQIGRLRQKLIEYYSDEGRSDPVIVSLPKGSFRLVFESASAAHQTVSTRWRRTAIGLGVAAAVLAVWAVTVTVRLYRSPAEGVQNEVWNRDLDEFWQPFVSSNRPVVVCLGTPLFMRNIAFGFHRVPSAITWEQLLASPQYKMIESLNLQKPSMPWFGYTGVGEAAGAFLVAKLLGTRRQDIRLTRSNLLSWQQITDSDIVFLGPPKFNIQLQGILEKLEIQMDSKGVRVQNPRPGELAYYADKFEPGPDFEGVTHAVITSMPGLSGQGRLLVVAGNASADTNAAAQWLTEPDRARQWASRLRQSSGRLPRSFQLVLRVQFKHGVPIQSSYVMHRVIG